VTSRTKHGKRIGRPPTFTGAPEPAASEILAWLYDGGSLLAYCRQEGKPKRQTIYDWVERDPSFGGQFARAREAGAGAWIEEAVEIARDTDPEHVQVAKLQVDTAFKRAACFAPHLYGTNRTQLAGDPAAPLVVKQEGPQAPSAPQNMATYLAKLAEAAKRIEAGGEDS